jgi:hypothetical protein
MNGSGVPCALTDALEALINMASAAHHNLNRPGSKVRIKQNMIHSSKKSVNSVCAW